MSESEHQEQQQQQEQQHQEQQDSNAPSSTGTGTSTLTPEQLARIERNKQQALQRLKQRQAEAAQAAASEQPSKRIRAEAPTGDRGGEEEEVCGVCKASAQLDPMMRDQFGERVCFSCKDGRDEYDLLCKADVMAEYLLPEGTIRVLRFVEKENPKKEGWNKMKLFLRKHAMEWALQRWGSMEELAAEKKRRQAAKYARAAKKVNKVLQSSSLQQL